MRNLASVVLGAVLAMAAAPALACSIWEPAEYEDGTVGRSEREHAQFVFLGRVEQVVPGVDRPASVRFSVVTPLVGRGPNQLTADGDFWRCYGSPFAATIDWRPGQLAVVYGGRSDWGTFKDHPTWDGWKLLEAVPVDRNRDPKIAPSLAQALRAHGH
jgi:hypothetical protein